MYVVFAHLQQGCEHAAAMPVQAAKHMGSPR